MYDYLAMSQIHSYLHVCIPFLPPVRKKEKTTNPHHTLLHFCMEIGIISTLTHTLFSQLFPAEQYEDAHNKA